MRQLLIKQSGQETQRAEGSTGVEGGVDPEGGVATAALPRARPGTTSSGTSDSSAVERLPADAAAATAARGEALRASMRQLLTKKGGQETQNATAAPGTGIRCGEVAAAPAQGVCIAEVEDDVDPWPELPSPFFPFAVDDCRRRGAELRRRGDFDGAATAWAKAAYVARRCSPPAAPDDIAGLVHEQAQALLYAGDCASAERVCRCALAQLPSASCAVQVLCCRARALAELGDADGARAAMADAIARDLVSMDGMDDIQEETRELEQRLEELEVERRSRTAELPCDDVDAPSDRADAAVSTEEFHARMENDYASMFVADGWDELRGAQQQPDAAATAAAEDTAAAWARQCLPEEALPGSVAATRPGAEPRSFASLQEEAAYYREKYRLPAPRCRRNLDELRRVEAETREAIEAEKKKLAEKSAACTGQTSIRTKSEVVKIESLSDSSDEDEGEDDEETASLKQDLNECKRLGDEGRRALDGLQEFQRLGREKQERLAKWRHLYGD